VDTEDKPATAPKVLDPAEVLEQLREVVETLAEERGEAPINGGMIKDARSAAILDSMSVPSASKPSEPCFKKPKNVVSCAWRRTKNPADST